MNNVYATIKKKKDWGVDPALVQLNPSFSAWMSELPSDLQVSFADDGSPPWLPSHFIGNLHSYYYLSIIMLHRPQLTFMDPGGMDGGWKAHMMMCYSSAKYLCRLQEAIINTFGLTGLLSMQRGINFTIYCILTCTVLHLVRITPSRLVLPLTIAPGCYHVARSRSQCRCARLFHKTHAYLGTMYDVMANA